MTGTCLKNQVYSALGIIKTIYCIADPAAKGIRKPTCDKLHYNIYTPQLQPGTHIMNSPCFSFFVLLISCGNDSCGAATFRADNADGFDGMIFIGKEEKFLNIQEDH